MTQLDRDLTLKRYISAKMSSLSLRSWGVGEFDEFGSLTSLGVGELGSLTSLGVGEFDELGSLTSLGVGEFDEFGSLMSL
ncbi:MAG: hypothetical protein D6675_12845 [Gemmatimonadetes bacterium]|nr:MAG: hypothetical protein D6675_12845 [Gemmatimonadota bacterium]